MQEKARASRRLPGEHRPRARSALLCPGGDARRTSQLSPEGSVVCSQVTEGLTHHPRRDASVSGTRARGPAFPALLKPAETQRLGWWGLASSHGQDRAWERSTATCFPPSGRRPARASQGGSRQPAASTRQGDRSLPWAAFNGQNRCRPTPGLSGISQLGSPRESVTAGTRSALHAHTVGPWRDLCVSCTVRSNVHSEESPSWAPLCVVTPSRLLKSENLQ